MVDTVLGLDFAGVLASDFYGAYPHSPGLKQRCWARLLREIHTLGQVFPDDAALQTWADAVHDLFAEARDAVHTTPEWEAWAAQEYRTRLLTLAAPVAENPEAPGRKLAARIPEFIGDLFIFVTEEVATTNNLAEQSLRPLVTRRKISGGSRSQAGTDATMALASLFGTRQLQDTNPSTACCDLLIQA